MIHDVTIDEPAEVLSIGCVLGGGIANRPWRDAISALTHRVIAARKDIESPLNLNVVFHVPGSMLKPEFEGVRTGRFSKAMQLLMVQVAVPEAVPPDPDEYLLDAVGAAIDEAERWAKRRGMATNLDALRTIAQRTQIT
jgi:hypothetical protein